MAVICVSMLTVSNPNISDNQMKRLLIIPTLLVLISCLTACSKTKAEDSFAAYHGMTSSQVINQAERNLASGDYDKAVTDLSAMDAIYPFGAYAQQAQLDVIYAYYKDEQPDMALASADRYLRLYPSGRHADYALYMKGVIQYKENLTWLQRKFKMDTASFDVTNNRSSFGAFAELVRSYPGSAYTADALARMKYLRNLFARHEMIIARYYFARHAYVAAINRASAIVVHYNGTSSTVPALKLLVSCYQHLGLSRLQQKTQKILNASTSA